VSVLSDAAAWKDTLALRGVMAGALKALGRDANPERPIGLLSRYQARPASLSALVTAGGDSMTPEQFTFQGMTSRQWAYKIIHESAGGPMNLGKLLREFAGAYAKHCVEQAERDKKVGCPSCGVAFTVQGEDLFRGEKAYALLERAEAADLKLAQMREALRMARGEITRLRDLITESGLRV
jgi:hypothetical protein